MNKKQLKQTALGFRSGILDGRDSEFMCFAVCAPLQGYLSALGVETRLVEGEVDCSDYNINHFWLELPDGNILDPTADQFLLLGTERRMPKVYIGPRPTWYLQKQDEQAA